MIRCFLALFLLLLSVNPSEGAEPVRIGVSLGLTGEYSVLSDMQHKAFKLWENDVNKKGGLLGREVSVIVYNDKSDPEVAKQLYERMMNEEKVDFVFGPYSTKLTEAILPLTERRRYPVVISGAAGDSLWEKGYKYAIGVFTPTSKYSSGFLELLVKADLNNIALVHAEDGFSRNLADSVKVMAKRYGLTIVLSAVVKQYASAFENVAQQARDSGASVLLLCGHFEESVKMRRALKRIGWYPRAYYASIGPAMRAFHDKLKGDAEHVFSTSLWEPRANFPGARRFEEVFTAVYGKPPSYQAALAYSGGQVLEAAVNTAGSFDREKVRAALFKLDAMTILGRYGVDDTGKQMRQHTFITQWQKGAKQIVWPETLKTATPLFK